MSDVPRFDQVLLIEDVSALAVGRPVGTLVHVQDGDYYMSTRVSPATYIQLWSTLGPTVDAYVNPERTVRKTADPSRVNDAVPTADPELTLPVAADTYYSFELFVMFSAAAIPDFKHGWTYPAGSQIQWVLGPDAAVLNTVATAVNLNSNGSRWGITLTGSLYSGAVGDFAFAWSQNVSDAGDTYVEIDSWMKLTQLNNF